MSDQGNPRNLGPSAGGWDNVVEAQPLKTDGAFIDQSESAVATIGSNYLQNYLSGGEVSKGIGILTQKRFYYKGKNFSGAGKETKSATEEGVVSVEDVTFTKFTHFRHMGLLALAILLSVGALAFLFIPPVAFVGGVLLIAAVPFYIFYFVKRESLFLVAFPGGGFAFDIRWYPISDMRDFQRQLHLLKDHIKEEATA